MKKYFSQNAKMARSTDKIFNFGIPAYKSASGFITCPMAGTCKKGCYAQQGAYVWSNVAQAYEARLTLTKSPEFVSVINAEIQRRKIRVVRVHDSGDFYSPTYARKWFEVMRLNPTVKFYAYTKMVRMFKDLAKEIPGNFTLIFSEGGKQDALINPAADRHSRVFPSLESLQSSGYADTHFDDSVAYGANPRVGLVYHGAKGRAWQTAEVAHA